MLLKGALNSLGLLRKQQGRFAEAQSLYTRASSLYDTCTSTSSPDAVVCRHTLAELALAAGDETRARAIQLDIVRRVEAGTERSAAG